MTLSYLGIISTRGLESLQLETNHAARFFMRRAYDRQSARALCCWAVLGQHEAAFIRRLIQAGDSNKALLMLNILAVHLGTLLPETVDVSDSLSTCG